jgi:hypothetical protein
MRREPLCYVLFFRDKCDLDFASWTWCSKVDVFDQLKMIELSNLSKIKSFFRECRIEILNDCVVKVKRNIRVERVTTFDYYFRVDIAFFFAVTKFASIRIRMLFVCMSTILILVKRNDRESTFKSIWKLSTSLDSFKFVWKTQRS